MAEYDEDFWVQLQKQDDDTARKTLIALRGIGNFDPSQYAGFAGYVQQLQFFYYRKTAKEESV